MHPPKRARHEHSGCRASTLRGERRQARAVACRRALSRPATKAESKATGNKPCLRPGADLAVGRDDELERAGTAVVAFDARIARGVEVEPCLRVVLDAIGEREFRVVRIKREETKHLAVRRLVLVSLGLVIVAL